MLTVILGVPWWVDPGPFLCLSWVLVLVLGFVVLLVLVRLVLFLVAVLAVLTGERWSKGQAAQPEERWRLRRRHRPAA